MEPERNQREQEIKPILETEKEEKSNNIYVLQKNLNNAKSDQNKLGLLGHFFGGSQNASFNILGLVVVLLVITVCVRWMAFGQVPPEIFFSSLMTIIGYLFGKL